MTSKTWCDIRNAYVRTLRVLRDDIGAGENEQALDWAIKRLEGLPEHWQYVESSDETPARVYHCNICGGEVNLSNAALPSVHYGPGGRKQHKQTDTPDDGDTKKASYP